MICISIQIQNIVFEKNVVNIVAINFVMITTECIAVDDAADPSAGQAPIPNQRAAGCQEHERPLQDRAIGGGRQEQDQGPYCRYVPNP